MSEGVKDERVNGVEEKRILSEQTELISQRYGPAVYVGMPCMSVCVWTRRHPCKCDFEYRSWRRALGYSVSVSVSCGLPPLFTLHAQRYRVLYVKATREEQNASERRCKHWNRVGSKKEVQFKGAKT